MVSLPSPQKIPKILGRCCSSCCWGIWTTWSEWFIFVTTDLTAVKPLPSEDASEQSSLVSGNNSRAISQHISSVPSYSESSAISPKSLHKERILFQKRKSGNRGRGAVGGKVEVIHDGKKYCAGTDYQESQRRESDVCRPVQDLLRAGLIRIQTQTPRPGINVCKW